MPRTPAEIEGLLTMERLPWLVLPDGTMLDLFAPGVETEFDFGTRSFPDPNNMYMMHEHSGYNILTVSYGGTTTRYGFIGRAQADKRSNLIRLHYDDKALVYYT
jgi:hypothetical protein